MSASVIDTMIQPSDALAGASLTMRDSACALAARNFKVFPCVPGTKIPLRKQFYDTATADPEEVFNLWTDPVTGWPQDYNIGILTGEGTVALDVDVKNGKPGLASLALLELPPTFTQRSGSGGLHLLLRIDRDVAGFAADERYHPLGLGIDVRGHHGYVVGAGSTVEGGSYSIEHDLPLAELPEAILAKLAAPRARSGDPTAPACELDTEANIARAAKYLREEAPIAIEGAGGDDTTFRVLCIAKDMGLSADAVFDLAAEHYNPRCAPAWDLDELRQKVDNAFTYALSPAGGQAPAVDLGGVEDIPAPRYVSRAALAAALMWADDPGADAPIQWLLKGLLPRTGVGIIYGPPKSGKSFVVFDLAARLAAGMPWFNVRTPKEPTGTLLLLGEGAGTVRTRLAAFRRATGSAVPPLTWASVANLSTAAGMAAARDIIGEALAGMAARGLRLGLIVVDTLASALGLEDENSAPEVTAALKGLEALAAEFDVAVLGIHHAGKNGQDRGSSAFRAACDVMLSVDRGEPLPGQADNHRQLSVVLNRNGEADWTANFRLERVVLGIDEDGDEITSCVVRPSGASPVELDRREILMAQFDPAIVHLLGHRMEGGGWGKTGAQLRTAFAEVFPELKPESRKKAVDRAIAELLKSGRLQKVRTGGDIYFVAVPQQIGGGDAPASLF